MARSVNLKEYLVEKIKEPRERAAYINAALEDGDPKILLAVLKDCVEAMGGISWLSHETHLTRAAIYAILSEEGNPKYENLLKLLIPLGLRLNVAPLIPRPKAGLVYQQPELMTQIQESRKEYKVKGGVSLSRAPKRLSPHQ